MFSKIKHMMNNSDSPSGHLWMMQTRDSDPLITTFSLFAVLYFGFFSLIILHLLNHTISSHALLPSIILLMMHIWDLWCTANLFIVHGSSFEIFFFLFVLCLLDMLFIAEKCLFLSLVANKIFTFKSGNATYGK